MINLLLLSLSLSLPSCRIFFLNKRLTHPPPPRLLDEVVDCWSLNLHFVVVVVVFVGRVSFFVWHLELRCM
jgi:hypothetical protein